MGSERPRRRTRQQIRPDVAAGSFLRFLMGGRLADRQGDIDFTTR